jgi:hypothetical protein
MAEKLRHSRQDARFKVPTANERNRSGLTLQRVKLSAGPRRTLLDTPTADRGG